MVRAAVRADRLGGGGHLTKGGGDVHLFIFGKCRGHRRLPSSPGRRAADVSRTLPTDKPILYGLQEITRENPDLTAAEIPDAIVICDELGCGVVPMDYEDRAWRERTGRLLSDLAANASRVDRVFCGIPMRLK